jgi:hypothetical protein
VSLCSPWLTWNLRSSCLCLSTAEITDMCYHAWPLLAFQYEYRNQARVMLNTEGFCHSLDAESPPNSHTVKARSLVCVIGTLKRRGIVGGLRSLGRCPWKGF